MAPPRKAGNERTEKRMKSIILNAALIHATVGGPSGKAQINLTAVGL